MQFLKRKIGQRQLSWQIVGKDGPGGPGGPCDLGGPSGQGGRDDHIDQPTCIMWYSWSKLLDY